MSKQILSRLRSAKRVLWWERLYAGFGPAVAAVFGFGAVSLFGVWSHVPYAVHTGALVVFLLALSGLTVWGARRFVRPDDTQALVRLETDNDLPPGTLADLIDAPLNGDDENPLWRAHIDRLTALTERMVPGGPRATIDHTDPYHFRVLAVLALVAGFFVAGPRSDERLWEAFYPSPDPGSLPTADVWIEPPAYTGLPPVFLVRDQALPGGRVETDPVVAGSILHTRLPRRGTERALEETVLTDRAEAVVRAGGRRTTYVIPVVPDLPPAVTMTAAPQTEGGTRTVIEAAVADDFGVAEGSVILSLLPDTPRPTDAPMATEGNREIAIPAPALRGPPGARRVTIDLSDHPWAGLRVGLAVRVTDGAGHAAMTEPAPYTLPARTFYNPLARTLIGERQNLALAPQSWPRTQRLLDALTYRPEMFSRGAREYLLVRSAFHELASGGGTNVPAVVESLLPLAIALEDEGLTLARQRLEAAQQALRNALADGLPQAEIDRLVEELRGAMNDYLAALAANGDAQAAENGDSGSLKSADLDAILDEIAQLRRMGDSAAARARLAQLEQMLANLRIQPGGEGTGSGQASAASSRSQPGEKSLDAAGDLIDQQRRLTDDTYAARRGEASGDGLRAAQEALGRQADELTARAAEAEAAAEAANGEAGSQSPGQNGEPASSAFGEASQAMKGAAAALRRGDLSAAQRLQETALDRLQDGAQSLADAAMAEAGEGSGAGAEGEGGQPGERGALSGSGEDLDPLGRRYDSSRNGGDTIPGLSDPERMQALTEELRRRLADPDLGDAERRYLERLLRRF